MSTDLVSNLTKEQIVDAMMVLKASVGWQILTTVLRDGELANLTKELKEGEFKTVDAFQAHQYKISALEQLLDLPDTLYAQYIQDNNVESAEEDDDDPYYQSTAAVRNDLLKERNQPAQ